MGSDTPDWLPDSSASVDLLVPLQTFTIAHSPTNFFNVAATLQKSYQSFYFYAFLPSVLGPYNITVTAFDVVGNPYYVDSFQWSFAGASYFALDIPGTVGGSVSLRVSGQPLGTTVQMAMWGSVSPRPGGAGVWRRDGRHTPLGLLVANFQNAAGGVMLAAPGAGSRYILSGGNLLIAANVNLSSVVEVNATINGILCNIGLAAGAVSSYGVGRFEIPPMGLLIDDNDAIAVAVGNAPAAINVSLYYDITN